MPTQNNLGKEVNPVSGVPNDKGAQSPVTARSLVEYANINRDQTEDILDGGEFWSQSNIDNTRWNKSFPYQFLVIKTTVSGQKTTFSRKAGWVFTLPIPPESLSISMPFAINVSATLGGIIEEHNGAPFRSISISGTTGVLQSKGSLELGGGFTKQDLSKGAISGGVLATFPGTVAGVTRTINAVKSVDSNLVGGNSGLAFNRVSITGSPDNEAIGNTSGYTQFHLLQQFFERYAELKKTPEGRNAVLAFANWKDTKDAVYLVSPVSFDVRRTAASPYEYDYSIQLKAWRRVVLDQPPDANILANPAGRNADKLSRILSSLILARSAIQSAKNTLKAAIGDIDRLLSTVTEVILLTKDIVGLAKSMADFPYAIQNAVGKQHNVWSNLISPVEPDNQIRSDGLSMDTLGAQLKQSTKTTWEADSHPASKVYRSGDGTHDGTLSRITPSMDLPPAIRRQMAAEEARVKKLTRLDFESRRDGVMAAATTFAEAVGAGNDTYNKTFNRKAVKKLRSTPTDQDYQTMYALNDVAMALGALAATKDNQPSPQLTTIEYIAGLARSSGIAFTVPTSKFAVPFPYGSNLEMLAYRYLGDPLRWNEIATINGLKEPYVDEVGFSLPLQVNGNGSEIVLADVSDIYVGQPVYLISTTQIREMRRVIGIKKFPGQNIVTLDGVDDIGRFKITESAKLEAFLPDTVNSQQLIYIPSNEPTVQNDFKSRSIPGINEYDPMIAVGGIDFLLDDKNDLVLTQDGDSKLAVGLANIVQRVRIILSTRKGSLIYHPDFGIPIEVGESVADITAEKLLSLTKSAFSNDNTFSAVRSTAVSVKGGTAQIGVSVEVTGVRQPIPVSFRIQQ